MNTKISAFLLLFSLASKSWANDVIWECHGHIDESQRELSFEMVDRGTRYPEYVVRGDVERRSRLFERLFGDVEFRAESFFVGNSKLYAGNSIDSFHVYLFQYVKGFKNTQYLIIDTKPCSRIDEEAAFRAFVIGSEKKHQLATLKCYQTGPEILPETPN